MLVLVQLNDDIASEKVQNRIKYPMHMRPGGAMLNLSCLGRAQGLWGKNLP